MKEFFNSNNPIAVFLVRIGRLFLVNVLLLICSIPIVTAGAALSAAHKVTLDMAYETEDHVIQTFFDAFKENFKPATLAWLITFFASALLYCDFVFVHAFFESKKFMYVMLSIPTAIVAGVVVYLFPLIARYRNSLRNYIRNAAIFALFKFHRTIAMVALHAIPIVLFLFVPAVFAYTLPVWLCIGISFILYIDGILLRPAFDEVEKEKEMDLEN